MKTKKVTTKKKAAKITITKKKAAPKKTKVKAVKAEKKSRPAFEFKPIPHPKFTDLVIITKAPSWAKQTIGKRYLNPAFAQKMINEITAERTIKGGERSVDKEIKSLIGEEIIKTDIEAVTVSDYDSVENEI